MLHFIIGRKNSGKTTLAHKTAGRVLDSGGQAMLIVPRQYTFETDKNILSLLGPRKASEVEVVSFTRLCHIVLSSYGGIKKPVAKNTARLIFMSLAVESLKDRLEVFAGHKNEISLVSEFLNFVDEMKNEGITADDLLKSAESISDNMLRQKIREASLVYRTYEAVINESAFDDADLLSRVYDILLGEDFFEGKTVILDGFSSFTYHELKLISLMMKKADDVYVTLCLPEINISQKTGPFVSVQSTAKKLMRLAGDNGVEVSEATVCSGEYYPEDISFLEKNIYNPVPASYEKESDNITVITASDFYDECDAVSRRIKRLIREGKYRCRDIAVVYRNDEKYEKQLKLSFRKYSLPFFEDRRQHIVSQPLINLLQSILLICSEGYDSDNVFRYIKTSLSGISISEASELENYCFMWDISGRKWLEEWDNNPDGFGEEMTESRREKLLQLNSLRRKIVEPLVSLRDRISESSSVGAIKALYEFLRENGIDERLKEYALELEREGYTDLAVEQEQVWDILMEAFDDMAWTLGERKTDIRRFTEIFSLVIGEKSLGKLPDGFDEVSIVSADRMLTKKAKVVFVVGLNAGLFPLNQSESGLLSHFERIKVEETGLALGDDIKDKSLKERFILYNALSSAEQELYLSFCILGGAGEKLSKSEGITLTERIIPCHKKLLTSEETVLDKIESEKSAFEIMAEKYRSQDTESESLHSFFGEKKEYANVLSSMARAVYKEAYEIENPDTARELFGKDLYFSASQMETYSMCPFRYFCRYGVGAKPRVVAKLDASLSGTLVHHVLEIILGKYKGKEFLKLSDEDIKREISNCLSEYMNEKMGGAEDKSSRFNYIYFRMQKVIADITERLRGEFAVSDFEPCDFELSISRQGSVKPFSVTLDNGSVQIRGIIDRVDKMDADGKRFIRIVDYKTGGKVFELSDVLDGLNMQMLLYLVSIWRNGTGEYENIIPAGVLYFPAKMSVMSVTDRNADPELRKENRYKAGKMNGIILDGYDMVSHMDKEGRGIFIPVTVDKRNGNIKGKFIDIKAMEKLAEKMDSIIRNTGNSIHQGKIPAKPVYGSSYTDICDYCDYREVCLEENPEKRYIQKISHEECIRSLREEEEVNEQKLDT